MDGRHTGIFSKGELEVGACVHACSVTWACNSAHVHCLQPHGLKPARLLCPWNFLGKNTGVDYHLTKGKTNYKRHEKLILSRSNNWIWVLNNNCQFYWEFPFYSLKDLHHGILCFKRGIAYTNVFLGRFPSDMVIIRNFGLLRGKL